MDRKIIIGVCLTVLILLLVGVSGCLDGPEDPNDAPFGPDPGEPVSGTLEPITGWVDAPEEATSIEVEARTSVDILVPESNVKSIDFTIKILDGGGDHEGEVVNTLPDQIVQCSVNSSGNTSDTLAIGTTEYSGQTSFQVPLEEPGYIEELYSIDIAVLCRASEDTWPGPMIWSGYPDAGFYYEITIEYQYIPTEPAPLD